jgi:hypothetical protein
MRHVAKSLVLGFLFFSACAPVKPELGTLTQVEGFTLTTSQNTMQSSSWDVPFQGKCTSSYSDIEWSYDGGATWSSVKTNAPAATIDCSGAGNYSGTLDISGISALTSSLQKQTSITILIRGQTQFGPSASLSILLLPALKSYPGRIVAGSHKLTGGTNAPGTTGTGMVLYGHVGGFISSSVSNGKLQGQLHSQYP